MFHKQTLSMGSSMDLHVNFQELGSENNDLLKLNKLLIP